MYSETPNAKAIRKHRLKKRGLLGVYPTRAPTTGRWKPGESGNPAGRPKKLPLTEAQAALLEKLGDLGGLKAKLLNVEAKNKEG